jgi:hypothetical protein
MCASDGMRHVCQSPTCGVAGRPFLVEGVARLAPTASRADWNQRDISPDLRGLSPETRARLAEHWTAVARMEHASIAAFARFALQLLAVGAPPGLVLGAQQAMADETSHTLMAFALASAYAGCDIGPGALRVDAALDACDLRGLVVAVLHEGCLGETAAALEAREALADAQDPVVRAVLTAIAEEETRHAALAWKTLDWALASGGEQVRGWIEDELRVLDAPSAARSESHREALAGHGVIDDETRTAIRHMAVLRVVRPLARAMLERAEGVAFRV